MTAMTFVRKRFLVNFGILAGLLLEYWRGAPWLIVLIVGLVTLILANTLMYVKHKRSAASTAEVTAQ